MNKSIFPPPNTQRTDPEFRFKNKNGKWLTRRASALCKGNCTQDLLVSIGLEFGVKELAEMRDSTALYSKIVGVILKKNPNVQVTNRMITSNANHMAMISAVLAGSEKTKHLEAFWVDIRRDPPGILEKTLKEIKRPVMTLGYPINRHGHWVTLYYPFYGNDPWGKFPYRTKAEKENTQVDFGSEFFKKHGFRSLIGIREK